MKRAIPMITFSTNLNPNSKHNINESKNYAKQAKKQ